MSSDFGWSCITAAWKSAMWGALMCERSAPIDSQRSVTRTTPGSQTSDENA